MDSAVLRVVVVVVDAFGLPFLPLLIMEDGGAFLTVVHVPCFLFSFSFLAAAGCFLRYGFRSSVRAVLGEDAAESDDASCSGRRTALSSSSSDDTRSITPLSLSSRAFIFDKDDAKGTAITTTTKYAMRHCGEKEEEEGKTGEKQTRP
eukprot:scaffold12214_cov159-Amphora_coffeaeformis.AAC.13